MKIRNLFVILGISALTTVNVMADVALPPRAMDHQNAVIAGTNKDPNRTAANPLPASPRSLDNQVKTIAGKDTTPAPSFARQLSGSPKDIGVCAEHPGTSVPVGGAATK